MRKLIISLIVISITVAGLLYYYVPREIDFNADGIKFRLGNENRGMENSVNVRVKGMIYRSWLGERTFKGRIDIEGEELPVPEVYRNTKIGLGKGNNGLMLYSYVKDGVYEIFSYGDITFAKDHSKVVFIIFERDNNNPERTYWNGEDGIMITAPASSREEALLVTNELMRVRFKETIFD